MNIMKKCPFDPGSSSDDVSGVAQGVVDQAICMATALIHEDPDEVFLYKCPQPQQTADSDAESSEFESIEWMRIEDFMLGDALRQLREYISLWELSKATQFEIVPRHEEHVHGRGVHYYVDSIFSKPTPKCPNPLAVAIVHFAIHVSHMLPPSHPIMVTYRFEGYKTTFYALGSRSLRSTSFQRFYIDTILHMKLSFYAEICEYAHPREPDEVEEQEVEEEEVVADVDPVTGKCYPTTNEHVARTQVVEDEIEVEKIEVNISPTESWSQHSNDD